MSDKKRKSASKDGERPSKKPHTGAVVRVSHVTGPDVAKPVIASSPGVDFPKVNFQSFAKPNGTKTNLLLHSSEHSTLDHTAREDDNSAENYLKHYIAVFDPEKGRLQVTEAKHLTVRSALRFVPQARDEDEEEETAPVTNQSLRNALTDAFGTKKSKKAMQSVRENRELAQGSQGADNPISAAMLSGAKEDDFSNQMSLVETLKNKPLPTANLETNELDQVYSLNTLVQPSPATITLESMPVKTWTDRISANKEVQTRSRFVANRVGYIAQHLLASPGESDPESKKALQVLRYIQLLLDLHKFVSHLPRKRPIDHVDKWPDQTMSEGTPMSLMRPVMNHFFPDRMPKDHSVTLLRTTILALVLHVPPPSMRVERSALVAEPTDISLDMAIEAKEVRRLYRELGCKLAPATENELKAWHLERLAKKKKDEAGNVLPKVMFAKLKFPLDFPKLSRGRQSARR